MKPVDRFQALIRHPDYCRLLRLPYVQMLKLGFKNLLIEDFLGRIKPSSTEMVEGIVFLRRWGLNAAVDPEDTKQVAAALNSLRAGACEIFRDDLHVQDASNHKDEIDPGHGRWFLIRVDLERPNLELLQLVDALVTKERIRREIKTKRARRHLIDPWIVWDMMQVPGNNLLKITRSLYGVQNHPTYDQKTNQAYSRVRRAYEKAESLIKEVATRCSKPLTEEDATVAFVVEISVAMADLLAQLFPPGPAQRIPFAPSPRQLARMTTKWKAWLKSELAKA